MAPRILLLVPAFLLLVQLEAVRHTSEEDSSQAAAAVEAHLFQRASELHGSSKPSSPLGDDAVPRQAFADDLVAALAEKDSSKVGLVLNQGLEAITLGIEPLMWDPPNSDRALTILDAQLWKVLLILVPRQHHDSPEMMRGKKAWSSAFASIPEFVREISDFRMTGDTSALTRAITSLISHAVKLFGDALAIPRIAPQMERYFDAVVDLIQGASTSWQLHASGKIAEATETIWKAVKLAVDEMAPAEFTKHRTYELVMGTVDGVMGKLTQHVLDYKRRILSSKVCYKRTILREKKRPNICREGFEWDQMHTCYPTGTVGTDCLSPCGGAGMCPSFCGQDMACCRRGDKGGPAECKGSAGFVDFAFTHGNSKDYHQCVTPGPAAAFKITGGGELDLFGVWIQTGVKSGRARYTLADDRNAILEWSESRAAWRIYIDKTVFGFERPTLFLARSSSKTFPTEGWEAVDGLEPVPRFEPLERPEPTGASLVQVTALDDALWRKSGAEFGTHGAMCSTEGDLEKAGHWCVSPCPAGYQARDANTCEQLCDGGFPAASWGMCGRSPEEVYAVVAETAAMSINGAAKAYILIDDMNKAGVDGEKLSSTINTFVDMGKPFAHPTCPEGLSK